MKYIITESQAEIIDLFQQTDEAIKKIIWTMEHEDWIEMHCLYIMRRKSYFFDFISERAIKKVYKDNFGEPKKNPSKWFEVEWELKKYIEKNYKDKIQSHFEDVCSKHSF